MKEFANPLERERLHFQPNLPQALQKIENLECVEGEKMHALEPIQRLFPKTCSQAVVHFRAGKQTHQKILKIGVVLSGGQAPGGHNVIAGLFDALQKIDSKSSLIGFLGGPSGILENKHVQLDQQRIALFRNTGGFDMIGSGRTKIESDDQLAQALKTCREQNLDGLVIIGGDDSNTNAAILAEYFLANQCKTCVIGVPKTIDGDLKNAFVETSFGFDTACKTYSEMIGNICRDALSAKKYTHFIKLMGRSASHIALECALQTHPNITLIGEEIAQKQMTLKQVTCQVADILSRRAQEGKNYAAILLPEGLIEFIPEMKILIQELNALLAQDEKSAVSKLSPNASETFHYLPKDIQRQLLLDRDPHGNVQVSHIATEQLFIHTVQEELKQRQDFKGKFSPIGHFFGYEGRCGYPSYFDTHYCYALGFTAAALIQHGLTGYMSVLQGLIDTVHKWAPVGIPLTMMMHLEQRKGKEKAVIKKALVNLEGEPFRIFASCREKWSQQDRYRFPGPMQLFGPPAVCQEPTFTLQFEKRQEASHAFN